MGNTYTACTECGGLRVQLALATALWSHHAYNLSSHKSEMMGSYLSNDRDEPALTEDSGRQTLKHILQGFHGFMMIKD